MIQIIYCIAYLLITQINAAGVAVHLNIASRIKSHLPQSVLNNPNEYYAGAFHPDAFYNCVGDLSMAAETAHWPPFLKSSIEYYNNHYISKGVKNDKLKAFIYGMFTHQVADVSWHSLHSNQGLLQLLTHVEFNDDNKKAHNYLDTIGDFITLHREFENLSEDDMNDVVKTIQMEWKYPIDDIVNIYHEMNFPNVDQFNLKFCMDRGYSALRGEIFTILTERNLNNRLNMDLIESPLTISLLNDYYYGGIDEISNTLRVCLKELNFWFINNVPSNPWDICRPVFKEHSIDHDNTEIRYDYSHTTETGNLLSWSNISSSSSSDKLYLSTGIQNSKFGTFFQIGDYLDETTLAISAPFEENEGSVYMIPISEILHNTNTHNIGPKSFNSLKISSSKSQNLHTFPKRFGDRMFTWKLDGFEYLVVSEPGTSQFKVFLSGKLIAILRSDHTSDVLGTRGQKQWNLITEESYDLNDDGFPDLVIGSMFSDTDIKDVQSGIVLVLDGKIFNDKLNDYEHYPVYVDKPRIISIESLILKVFQTPSQLKQENFYEQFGSSYSQSHNQIFIGINSIGSLAVFSKKTLEFIGLLMCSENQMILKHQIDTIQRKPSKETSLFAYNKILTGKFNDKEWLLVTMSGYTHDKIHRLCGIAYLYIIGHDNSIRLIKKILPFSEHEKKDSIKFTNSMFGSNMKKLSDSLIIISSNGYADGRGALFLVNLTEILGDESVWDGRFKNAELLVEGEHGIGFNNFGNTCIESFLYENELYLAISLAEFFFAPSSVNQKLHAGSVLITKIS